MEDNHRIAELAQRIRDVRHPLHEDYDLLKWLTACRNDVGSAEVMYRKSMAWRREVGADDILETYVQPEILRDYYPGGFSGRDKEGRPVVIDPVGCADIKGMMLAVGKEEMIRFTIWKCEWLQDLLRDMNRGGQVVGQCVQILDLEGFGSRQMWVPGLYLYIDVLKIVQDNYPETLHRTFIINAPSIFNLGFNMLKSFLDEKTVEKFIFLGSDWKTHISEYIDPSQLPVKYGGIQTDPDGDPSCKLKINYGGIVPPNLIDTMRQVNFPEEGTKTVQVGRGSTLKLQYDIHRKIGECAIRYMFMTDNNGIEFTAFRKSFQDKKRKSKDQECLIPKTFKDSHLSCIDGTIVCDMAGTYVLKFKNTSGLLSKRKLTYYTEIVELNREENKFESTLASGAALWCDEQLDDDVVMHL